MRGWIVGVVCCLWWGVSWAQPTVACQRLAWDYPTGQSALVAFEVWAGQTSGHYDIRLLMIPSVNTLVLSVSCAEVQAMLPGVGRWYLAMRATGTDGQLSDWSNEVILDYQSTVVVVPPSNPTPTPPRQTPPTIPVGPPTVPPPPIRPTVPPPTPPSAGGGYVTDSPRWTGPSAVPSAPAAPRLTLPPSPPPPSSGYLTESCRWKGGC